MPIVKLVKPPCSHKGRPEADRNLYGDGTIWMCDDCEVKFRLTYSKSHNYLLPTYVLWVEMTQEQCGLKDTAVSSEGPLPESCTIQIN